MQGLHEVIASSWDCFGLRGTRFAKHCILCRGKSLAGARYRVKADHVKTTAFTEDVSGVGQNSSIGPDYTLEVYEYINTTNGFREGGAPRVANIIRASRRSPLPKIVIRPDASSHPGENGHGVQKWRRNTSRAGKKPRADWNKRLATLWGGKKITKKAHAGRGQETKMGNPD
jgi:hypothetical protein